MKLNFLDGYFDSNVKLIGLFMLFALIIVFAPWFVIWSINTLIPAASIPFNFDTWCAIVLLHAFLRSSVSVGK